MLGNKMDFISCGIWTSFHKSSQSHIAIATYKLKYIFIILHCLYSSYIVSTLDNLVYCVLE